MAGLDEIVNVTITIQDAAASQAGFGTPAMLGRTDLFPDLAREYTSITSFLADFSPAGVTDPTDEPNVRLATAIFSQQPRPTKLVFLRQTSTATAQTVIMTCTAATAIGQVYTVTINGTDFSFPTVTGSESAADIALALDALINAGAEPVTSTDNFDGTFDLVADVAGDVNSIAVNDRGLISQDDQTLAEAVVADLTAARAINDDWYSLNLTSNATLDTVAMAAHIETLRRQFFYQTADDDVPADTGGNLMETLNVAAYTRTSGFYHPAPDTYPSAAWAGAVLPFEPGSVTWKFQTLAGIAAVTLTDTERGNILGNEGNVYQTIAGINTTCDGTEASGRFIDVTRTIDKLFARLQENIFTLLSNANKVPFTDSGVAQVEGQVRATLQELVATGALTPDFTVTVPLVANVSTTDKANRNLPDVEFTAVLAGAIHRVEIAGTVSV